MTPRDRLAVLRRLFRDRQGPVTTGMVHDYYRAKGISAQRTTARHDLKTLVRQGLIYAKGPDNDLKFFLKTLEAGR